MMTTFADHGARAPIACELTAIPADLRPQHIARSRALFGELLLERRERDDGFAFRFPAHAYAELAAFVANERLCCPFLTFVLEVPPQHADVWLILAGDPDVKQFVRAEFAAPAQ